MLDLSGGRPLIPTGFYHDFRLQRCPLPSHIVWIGAYRDSTHAAWARHYGLHVGISTDEPPNPFSTTFTAFRVVFQVFGHFTRGRAYLEDRRLMTGALTPIWPPVRRPVDWPPRGLAFGDGSLLEGAESVARLAMPSPQGPASGGQPTDQ